MHLTYTDIIGMLVAALDVEFSCVPFSITAEDISNTSKKKILLSVENATVSDLFSMLQHYTTNVPLICNGHDVEQSKGSPSFFDVRTQSWVDFDGISCIEIK